MSTLAGRNVNMLLTLWAMHSRNALFLSFSFLVHVSRELQDMFIAPQYAGFMTAKDMGIFLIFGLGLFRHKKARQGTSARAGLVKTVSLYLGAPLPVLVVPVLGAPPELPEDGAPPAGALPVLVPVLGAPPELLVVAPPPAGALPVLVPVLGAPPVEGAVPWLKPAMLVVKNAAANKVLNSFII